MQAMSIQVKALQQNAEPVVLSAPAQVTVPINRQQVVSASCRAWFYKYWYNLTSW